MPEALKLALLINILCADGLRILPSNQGNLLGDLELENIDGSFELTQNPDRMGYMVEYNPHSQFNTGKDIPKVIIQYGPGRTATTLQFHSLCAIMILLHPGQVTCKGGGIEEIDLQTENMTYKVIKTHDDTILKTDRALHQRFWLFITSEKELNSSQIAENMKVEPEYIQSFPLVKAQGSEVIADYAPIFRLSSEESNQFLDYMKHWSLLRQCCGAQQSKLHRPVLWGDVPSSECPACDGQDLDVVESELVDMHIFQQMRKDNITQDWAQPDPHFNGTYCSWFNRQVGCQHLGFNEVPSEPFC